MNEPYNRNKLHMLRLGYENENDKAVFEAKKIVYNKATSQINTKARANAKSDHCYVCKKECSSFCNSHSVPKFALKRIANNGKVYSPLHGELPLLGDYYGVSNAGTFHLICRDCDSTLFQDYENPSAYLSYPTNKMLAQIAMKNYLHLISKRREEIALYEELSKKYPYSKDFCAEKNRINYLDLDEYERSCKRALRSATRSFDDTFYLFYYRQLDYVVPLAGQASIAVISDFDDKIINDVFNTEAEYHVKELHLAVLPLEETSVIMMFIDSENKRYRNFYRQFKKLTPDDQLATVNYILFSYSENVFIAESVRNIIKNNLFFLDVCQKTIDAESPMIFGDPISTAVEEFSLKLRHNIPNLLDRDYAIFL